MNAIEKKCLMGLLILCCLIRLPILLSHFHPSWDELERGSIAIELLDGLHAPFLDYQLDPYAANSLFAGLRTVPFFLLFGKTLFALRLEALFWSLLSLVAWYFVWRKAFSLRQTFFILLFFVLSPPFVTMASLENGHYHFETIFWTALTLLIFRGFLEEKLSSLKAGLLLGSLGGFSSWMVLTNLLMVATLFVYLILSRKKAVHPFRFLGYYLVSFLVCFNPLIFYNWHYGWQGSIFLEGFFRNGIPFSWVFSKGLHSLFDFGRVFRAPCILFYCASFVFLFWHKRHMIKNPPQRFDIEIFGLVFQCLLWTLFVTTNSGGFSYYLLPMVPFMGMTMVVAASRLHKILQVSLALFYVSAALLGNFNLISWPHLGSALKIQGYSYEVLGKRFADRFASPFPLFREKFGKLVAGRPLEIQKIFYQSIPNDVFKVEKEEEKSQILSFIDGVNDEIKPILYEKLEY